MRIRTIVWAGYMIITILLSLTLAATPALFLFFFLFQNLDSIIIGFGWPFPEIQSFFQNMFTDLVPSFLFDHLYFIVLIVPIFFICYGIFLGILIGMFKLSRRGMPYLENGYYPQEDEDWLLYEFHLSYYLIIPHFIWMFSIFFDSRIRQILFGAKIGKGTIVGGADVLPPDRVVIGDNCLIGRGAILCGHVYEGSRLYLNTLTLGNNVTVGGYAILFPGSVIGDNVIIGANTVVPKDRTIPPNTIWVHGKAIPRKDLPWQVDEEYKALAEEPLPVKRDAKIEVDERAEIPSEGEHI
jgi:carbonic anhydrase/acetyltransferase-like protein (isoleucine patch superfamily)